MESLLRLDMCVIFVLCVLFCVNTGVLAVDNFNLLYGSLRTFQAHACDAEELNLNCTHNTVISINFVQYGRREGTGDVCPGPGSVDSPTCRLDSALKVIERRCRGQMICRLWITPEAFEEDPCPGVRKYVEVAYKCRPENFKNKIVCDGDHLYLSCPKGESLTVYSAFFGTSTQEVLECAQPDGLPADDCQMSYATEILMKRCNGHQVCSLTANAASFGDTNCKGRKHLKVTYNCVKSELVKRPVATERSSEETIHTTSFPGWVRAFDQPLLNSLQKKNDSWVGTSAIPPNTFRSEMQSDEVPLDGSKSEQLSGDQNVVGFMSEWMSAQKYMAGNKEKLILYVTLTLGIGFLVFVTVLIARFMVINVKSRRNSKVDITPVTEDQFFSDSDLENYDPPPPPPSDLPLPVVNYTASLRRQSSDAQPRAPVTDGSELNHYFS